MRKTAKKIKNNIVHTKGMILYVVIAVVIMVAILLSWAKITSVNRFSISDRIVSQSTEGNTTTYVLNVNDINALCDYSLHFKSYGNAIQVKMDGEEIYSYGFNYMEKHKDIGRIYVSAFLPENGENLEIILVASDTGARSTLAKIELCAKEDTGRYYLSNDTLGFPMAIVYAVLGIIGLVIGIAIKNSEERYMLIYFAAIVLSMAVELADTGGHYLVFFRNQYVWNIIFYFASYILPIAAPCYGYAIIGKKFPTKHRRIAYIGIWLCAAYGVVSAVLSLATRLRFCDFAFWNPFNIGISIAFGCYAMIFIFKLGIIKQSTFVLFSLGTLLWGVVALILLLGGSSMFGSATVTPIDMESLLAILLISVLGASLFTFFNSKVKEMRAQQLKNLELENELLTMQYKVFVSQMQPHFLYNALSSIRQIVHEDPNYAADLLKDFTVHLRATIRSISNDKMIPFDEEVKNIKAYVKIEQMRLGDKLKINYDIETDDFEIIPLSIQPLVENSIRHGIYHKGPEGGTITLRTRELENGWKIEVIDDGVGFDPDKVFKEVEEGTRDSTGLKSLLFRLVDIMHANVEINSKIGEGTHITIWVPEQDEVKNESDNS